MYNSILYKPKNLKKNSFFEHQNPKFCIILINKIFDRIKKKKSLETLVLIVSANFELKKTKLKKLKNWKTDKNLYFL